MRRLALLAALSCLVVGPAHATDPARTRAALEALVGPPRYLQCLPAVDPKTLALGTPPAADPVPAKQRTLLPLVDSSGSMAGRTGGRRKIDISRSETARAGLDALRPVGWTPLAAALRHASAGLPDEEGTVWVISDGRETCGGDPVAGARAIRARGQGFVVNVVGMDLPAAARAQMEAALQTYRDAIQPLL